MKFEITKPVSNKPLCFNKLDAGDIFLLGNDYEGMFIKTYTTYDNDNVNAVSLVSGKGFYVMETAPVKKLITPIKLSYKDFTTIQEEKYVPDYRQENKE